MYKVAVCYRGDFRNWDILKDHHFYVLGKIKNVEIDFFFSTWSMINYVHQKFPGSKYNYSYNIPLNLDSILEDFKDRNLIDYNVFNNDQRKWHHNGPLNQYKLIYDANLLKRLHEVRNNFTYDYVVSLRTDLMFLNNEIYEVNQHMIPNREDDIPSFINKKGKYHVIKTIAPHDLMFCGPSPVIDMLSNAYHFLKTNMIKKEKSRLDAHHFLGTYLRRFGILQDEPIVDLYRRIGDLNKVFYLENMTENKKKDLIRISNKWWERKY